MMSQSWFWHGWFRAFLKGVKHFSKQLCHFSAYCIVWCGGRVPSLFRNNTDNLSRHREQLRHKLCSFWTWKAELRDLGVPSLLHTWGTPGLLLGSFDKLHLPFTCFKNSLYQLILPFPVLSTPLIWCEFYLLCVNKEGTTNNEYWAWAKDMIFISKHLLVYVFPVTVSRLWLMMLRLKLLTGSVFSCCNDPSSIKNSFFWNSLK